MSPPSSQPEGLAERVDAIEAWIAEFREVLVTTWGPVGFWVPGELKERPRLRLIKGGAR
jgi:hypothetical protein